MATAFQSINISLGPRDHRSEATTPTTPRAPFDSPARHQPPPPHSEEKGSTTPTRQSFAESNGKRALPTSPLDATFRPIDTSLKREEQGSVKREDSNRSTISVEDIDMTVSDGEEEGSDGESVDGENGRPSKKKKGQRFFCTDYPPCNLSFTRSEHLARHIRKHTGERPFKCHCNRQFSRLDNLRQHAQTVHVNEDIPGDSLAATGTRFQRQIRTDRVRPQSGRSRASTAGSQGSHGRGHSRNLSTSSIASTSSTMSTMSTISNMSSISRENSQRRPQPLMMADQSPRARLTIDTMKASPQQPYGFGSSSPGGATTPTSVTYSNGPGSPFGSTLGSPMAPQQHSGYWGDRTPGRRLSVPSGANPFQPASGTAPGPQYFKPLAPSNASHDSSNSSMVTSPTSSIQSFNRQDSITAAEADLRRRTWHPSTYSNYSYHQRPATSGLIFQQTPDAPRPAFAPQPVAAAASQPQRLPGFETFDQISQRPPTPPRHPNHVLETHHRPSLFAGSSDRSIPGAGHRRGHASWDMSLHHNLTKLEIANGTPPKEPSAWGKQVIADIHNASTTPSHNAALFATRPPQPPPTGPLPDLPKRPAESDHYPKPRPVTPQRNPKHTAWYNGPPAGTHQMRLAQRTSPEDSSSSEGVPTPSTVSLDYQPSIIHANGYIEPQPSAGHSFQNYSSQPPQLTNPFSNPTDVPRQTSAAHKPDMSGLEALVAVATSEGKNR